MMMIVVVMVMVVMSQLWRTNDNEIMSIDANDKVDNGNHDNDYGVDDE